MLPTHLHSFSRASVYECTRLHPTGATFQPALSHFIVHRFGDRFLPPSTYQPIWDAFFFARTCTMHQGPGSAWNRGRQRSGQAAGAATRFPNCISGGTIYGR